MDYSAWCYDSTATQLHMPDAVCKLYILGGQNKEPRCNRSRHSQRHALRLWLPPYANTFFQPSHDKLLV